MAELSLVFAFVLPANGFSTGSSASAARAARQTAATVPCRWQPARILFSIGLVELGVFHLLHQLVLWLQRAAEGTLIDHGNGWEATLRRDLSSGITIDPETCRAAVDRAGGYRVFKTSFYRIGEDNFTVGKDARAWLTATHEQAPLKHGDKNLFKRNKREGISFGETVCCIVWPDKLPSGADFVAASYMPETVDTYRRLLERSDELGCGRALRVFFANLERVFDGLCLEVPIPIAVILCARAGRITCLVRIRRSSCCLMSLISGP
jgi:hypothetical protein